MTRFNLMADITALLKAEFSGYELLNKSGELQEVHVYAQYIPQPDGVSFGNTGLKNYTDGDYDSHFPCLVVRLEDMTDTEERSLYHSGVQVKILQAVVDKSPECEGWKDLLNMQDKIRKVLFEHRVLGRKHILKMPCVSKLLDVETWPVYYGEMSLTYEAGRPVMNSEYVYRPPLNPPRM